MTTKIKYRKAENKYDRKSTVTFTTPDGVTGVAWREYNYSRELGRGRWNWRATCDDVGRSGTSEIDTRYDAVGYALRDREWRLEQRLKSKRVGAA